MVSEGLVTIPESARCWGCGYSLRGLGENRCPECGRGFEPRDRRSFRYDGSRRWWVDWLTSPPMLFMIWLQVFWALASMVALSVPGEVGERTIRLLLAGFAMGLVWLIRALVALLVYARWHAIVQPAPGRLRRWAVFPIIVCVCWVMLYAAVPIRVRFLASLPWLNEAATATDMETLTWAKTKWVGLFPIDKVDRLPNGVQMRIEGSGRAMSWWGLAYSTTPLPARTRCDLYWPLWGDWYVWKYEF